MAFTPIPCAACGGEGGPGAAGFDSEQLLLCDIGPNGELFGTAIMVTEFPGDGSASAAPTPVNPVTGAPYVAQGTLQPCPGDTACLAPVQFCFTTTTTGPVDHPGRTYDVELPINPGFAVDSLQIDATNYPANLTWAVTDADGEQFRAALESFLAARFPEQTVAVTNPNAGTPVCGIATPMAIHIECARIDDGAPDLVELIYNGGRDLVVNPAYLTTPPTNLNGPQFVYLRRQDAGGTLNCTNVANQGWETNDLGDGARDFELWGQGPGGLQTIQNTTPTPRGTPVQEITADINDSGTGPTIWQTFVVPAAGTVRVVLVHGARDNGETHRITLSTGDTNDNQVGDIINNVTNPPQVTNAGGNSPGPWTTFQQDVALGAGTYTFAISTTNPVGPNRGGLFTDMRVIVDSPDQHAAAVTDDDTCVVTTEETVTTTTCEWWSPRCAGNGEIVGWRNAADGQELDNASFWGQVPAPSCCTSSGGSGGGGSVAAGNLSSNYTVCAVVGGIPQTVERVVITDQSGGQLAQTFIGANGGPVSPTSYTIGTCGDPTRDTEIIELCDVLPGGGIVPFIRVEIYNSQDGSFVASRNEDGTGGSYNPTGTVTTCSAVDTEQEILCDDNGPFLRVYTRAAGLPVSVNELELDGVTDYVAVGTVVVCGDTSVTDTRDSEVLVLCDSTAPTPVRFLRKYLYDGETGAAIGFTNTTLDGTTPYAPVGAVGVCTQVTTTDFDFLSTVLCDSNGTQFIQRLTFNSSTGAVTGTTNTTLTGGAFAPVGAVSLCANCCPQVIGQGCISTGSGRYTAIRNTNGTVSLIDSVTGAAALAANIIACPGDDTVITQSSEARLLAAGQSWTPGGDLVGTLTGLTFQVLTGTASLVDSSGTAVAAIPAGTSVSWNGEDNNILTGPQSITADAASTVLVSWTRR